MAASLPNPSEPRSPLGALDPVWTGALLLALALAAWFELVTRTNGMDAGPGTSLGSLGWFAGIWVAMMAAMMFPSVEPTVLLVARIARQRDNRASFAATWLFVAGYLAVWTGFGLVVYGLYRLVTAAGTSFLAWDRAGPYVVGETVIIAGVYELSTLKGFFLDHCRNPFHSLYHEWRGGKLGAVRMGLRHGLYCLGCCVGLMVALFALGAMSLVWMALVTAVIFVEKVLTSGSRVTVLVAAALIAGGLWVAVAPRSVPALIQPDHANVMQPTPGSG